MVAAGWHMGRDFDVVELPAISRGQRSVSATNAGTCDTLDKATIEVADAAVTGDEVLHADAVATALGDAAPQVVVLPAVQPAIGGVAAERSCTRGADERHRIDVVAAAQPLRLKRPHAHRGHGAGLGERLEHAVREVGGGSST